MNKFNHIFDMKNKKKVIFTFYAILLFAILGGIFVSYSASKSTPVINQTESTSAIKLPPVTNKDQVLIAKIPEANIYLYANKKNMEDELYKDVYKDLTLYSGGISKQFFWTTLTMEGKEPTILLEDLNNDNKKELIIIFIHGTGFGVHEENVHILDKDTLTEFSIQPFRDILIDNVYTKPNENSYEVNIKNETFVINKSTLKSQPQNLYKEIHPYGSNWWNFKIKDNKLSATVPFQVAPSEYLGEVVIEYMFQDGRYVMESIKLNKYK